MDKVLIYWVKRIFLRQNTFGVFRAKYVRFFAVLLPIFTVDHSN